MRYTIAGIGAAVFALVAKWIWAYLHRLEEESRAAIPGSVLLNTDTASEVSAPSIHEDASKSLSIVVPAYNEEFRLLPTLEETMQYLRYQRDKRGPLFTYEVIIVDDGSTDQTARVATTFAKPLGFDAVRVIQLPVNKGKGHAVRCGMLIARGQSILFMDADGATSISDMGKLETELRGMSSGSTAGSSGLVIGSRAHLEQQAIAKRHWIRNFLMHSFHLLVVAVAGSAIRDTQCGFKLFSRQAARVLYSNQRLQRWCFDVELIFLANRLRIPMKEVAVSWTEIAGSKIKFTSILHMSWELVAIVLGYRLTRVWSVRDSRIVAHSKRS